MSATRQKARGARAERPSCKAFVWVQNRWMNPCCFAAKENGYCGHHDPARVLSPRRKAGRARG